MHLAKTILGCSCWTPEQKTYLNVPRCPIIHYFYVSYFSLTKSQISCLEGIKLPYHYSILSLFLSWVKEGLYDFCGLPLSLKVHMSGNDGTILDQLPAQYQGSMSQLLSELKGLNDILLHAEAHLVKTANEQARVSYSMKQ